jgi:hypothetical protein
MSSNVNNNTAYNQANKIIKECYSKLNNLLKDLKIRIAENKQTSQNINTNVFNMSGTATDMYIMFELLPNINTIINEFIENFEQITNTKINFIKNNLIYKGLILKLEEKSSNIIQKMVENSKLNVDTSYVRNIGLLITYYITNIIQIKLLLNEQFQKSNTIKNQNIANLATTLATIGEFIPAYKQNNYYKLIQNKIVTIKRQSSLTRGEQIDRSLRRQSNINGLEKSVINILKKR